MNLAIFDIDGTLTQGTSHFESCYVRAVVEEFDFENVSGRWRDYPQVCDSGILNHLFMTRFNRGPSREEESRFKERYLALLKERSDDAHEVPGAREALERLSAGEAWKVALATGNWRESARMKLRAAGFNDRAYPLAGADDSEERDGIVRAAIERARRRYGIELFERVVYVGDAPWDLLSARRLGMPFVGRDGRYGEELRRKGASHLLEDFRDYPRLLESLGAAK